MLNIRRPACSAARRAHLAASCSDTDRRHHRRRSRHQASVDSPRRGAPAYAAPSPKPLQTRSLGTSATCARDRLSARPSRDSTVPCDICMIPRSPAFGNRGRRQRRPPPALLWTTDQAHRSSGDTERSPALTPLQTLIRWKCRCMWLPVHPRSHRFRCTVGRDRAEWSALHVLTMIRHNHARKFPPGSNESNTTYALSIASCTRSSASAAIRVNLRPWCTAS
jgi:hypothetical protein